MSHRRKVKEKQGGVLNFLQHKNDVCTSVGHGEPELKETDLQRSTEPQRGLIALE